MSHSKEREEKICLNCGAELTGRYCSVCGQENTEPKETVWGLVSHFFNDITHFDGKFFSTVKSLITKPGFLSAEYIKGRRASYLHPIRMYVFTSAFFFIIFFSLFNPQNLMKGNDPEKDLKDLQLASTVLKEKIPRTKDAVLKSAMQRSMDHIDAHAATLENKIAADKIADSITLAKRKLLLDSLGKKIKVNPVMVAMEDSIPGIDSLSKLNNVNNNHVDLDMGNTKIGNITFDYRSRLAYDSVQKELPPGKRDGWFKRGLEHKVILFNDKWKDDKKEAMALFMEKFMHTMPQALFISLPLFALILLMLYARRKFYYVDHGIFAIHLYCAIFMFLLVYFGFDRLRTATSWEWLTIFTVLLGLGGYFYLYKAMRKFYGQGRIKTILKFIILIICSYIIVILLAIVFLFLSVIQYA